MASESAVCTITGSNPSAVAFRSYPGGIPDPLLADTAYRNSVAGGGRMVPAAADWRCVSEDYGGSSRPPKRGLPMSPAHIQAIQQCAVQRQHHQQQQQPSHPDHVGLLASWHGPPPTQRLVHHHYPTPPSQHGYPGGAAAAFDVQPGAGSRVPLPIPPAGCQHPEQFLTPSPDSPGQWSSSSPHSGHSDWSEGISSPAQAAAYPNQPNNQRLAAGNCRKDGIFLVRS